MASSPPNDESLTDQDWLQAVWKRADRDDILVAAQEEARRREHAARVPEAEARARDRDLFYGFKSPPSRVVGAFDMNAVEDKDFMPPLDNLPAAQTALAPVKRLDLGGDFSPRAQLVNYQRDNDSAYPRMVLPAAVSDAPIHSANCHDAVTRQMDDKTERRILAKRLAREAREGTSRADETPPQVPSRVIGCLDTCACTLLLTRAMSQPWTNT